LDRPFWDVDAIGLQRSQNHHSDRLSGFDGPQRQILLRRGRHLNLKVLVIGGAKVRRRFHDFMNTWFHENSNGTVGLRMRLLIEFRCWDFDADDRGRLDPI